MMPAETPPPKILSPNSLMNSEKIRAKSPTSLYSPLAQDNRNNSGTENAEKPVPSPLQQHPSPAGSYGGSSREQQSTESGSGSVPATSTTGLISPNSTSSNKQNPSRAAQSATSQQFCLRWNNYQSNLTSVFDQLLQNESFVDVTLACDGQSIKAHKMVLSACSPYFQALFFDNPCQHPIIIMRDIKWMDLKAAVDFMYKGEINVSQDQIGPLLRVAEMLKIRGLADVSSDTDSTAAPTSSSPSVRAPTPAVTASSPIPSRPPSSAATHVKTEFSAKKPRVCREWEVNNVDSLAFINRNRKRRWPSADHSGMESPIMHGSLGLGGNSSGMGIGSSANNSLRENSSSRSGANDMGLGGVGGGNGAGGNAGSGSSQQSGGGHMTPDSNNDIPSPLPGSSNPTQLSLQPATPNNMPPFTIPPPLDAMGLSTLGMSHADDMEIKPGIAEMIREEERAKLMESSHAWLGASTSSIADNSQGYSRNLTSSIQSDSYQYQLQSMWQKCWNTNQNLMHHLRFRERGPLKSWRPETMAEAIFSVLKEGLSLSQAARKYDIPYPTFVLYANRVHNMLGPSIDGGADLRPKGRGRPQRILLGIWPDEHIKGVIKTVVFRDAKELKEETIHLAYGRHSPVFPFQDSPLNYPGAPCSNGLPPQPPVSVGESMSPEATAAAVAAVAQGIRQQMQLAAAAQHHPDAATNLFSLPSHLHSANSGVPLPKQSSPASSGQNMNSNSQRHSSPSMPVLPSPSALGMTGIPGVHVMQPIGPNTSQSGAPISSSTSYTSNSLQTSSASAHMTPNTSTANVQMNVSNMSRMGSPSESAHDLRMNSPEESPLNSPLQMALEPAVNLAVGVSGMAYKPSRGYSPPRAENLFQEDIADLVGAANRNCPQNMNSFKEPTPTIKLEPMAGCRSD